MKKSDIIKYNLKFNHIDSKNPVTIGNGDFAITLDQTGTQSLYETYKDIPLSTMSNKNWFYKDKKNIKPSYVDGKAYMLFNLDNDPNYQINRQYPFKYSFMQILLYDNDKLIDINNIKDVKQELDLYKGIVTSSFNYKEKINKTISFIYQDHDEFNFKLQSDNLNLALKFNYPSYTKNGYRLDILPNVLVKEDRITLLYDDKNSLSFKLKSSSNYQIVENTLIFDDNNVSFSLALDEIKEGKLLDEFWKCDNGIIIDNEELVKKRLEELNLKNERVFVADYDGKAVGYLHAQVYKTLYFDELVNFLGLAVSKEYRKHKIGTKLIKAVENWALSIGINKIRVNSGYSRKEAHEFYRKLGYNNEKEQIRFLKEL